MKVLDSTAAYPFPVLHRATAVRALAAFWLSLLTIYTLRSLAMSGYRFFLGGL